MNGKEAFSNSGSVFATQQLSLHTENSCVNFNVVTYGQTHCYHSHYKPKLIYKFKNWLSI